MCIYTFFLGAWRTASLTTSRGTERSLHSFRFHDREYPEAKRLIGQHLQRVMIALNEHHRMLDKLRGLP